MLRALEWKDGARRAYGPHVVGEAELIAYARELDPQPMHLDARSEQARLVGGLIGSGWQTAAINHAMVLENLFAPGEAVALLAMPRLKWAAPARVGDVLRGRARLKAHRACKAHPGHTILHLATALTNQRDEVMLEAEIRLLVRGELGPGEAALTPPPAEDLPRSESPVPLGPVEAMPAGLVIPLGQHTFEPGFTRDFAQRHDPLPGLLDPDNPGVSGWHAAARWLRQFIDMIDTREAAGEALPRRGPGMGLENLIWRAPVHPGDTLHYYSRVISARRSRSRPGWGILTLRNYAYNQHGVAVLAFTCFWLWEARGKDTPAP